MITYSRNPQPELNDKIETGLIQELEKLKGRPCPSDSYSLYAYDGENLIGGIIFEQHDDVLWIDSLWVDEFHRDQRIGQKLLQQVVDFAHKNCCDKIQLTTYFSDSLPFYENRALWL